MKMLCLENLLLKCILQSENRQIWVFVDMFNRMMESKLEKGFAAIYLMYRSVRNSASVFKALMVLGRDRRCLSRSRSIMNAEHCCGPKYCH